MVRRPSTGRSIGFGLRDNICGLKDSTSGGGLSRLPKNLKTRAEIEQIMKESREGVMKYW